MSGTFLFYDLETFGACPRRSRIAQFAAIRTDADLQEVGDPICFFVKPANDVLPSPGATLVTGITPQYALAHGMPEAEAFARIHDEMMQPGTCTVGYNSLRFDDEFVRFGLFRNFYDPYEREWRGGNCRWDLLDVMRLAHALRPDGIEWTYREDGTPAFTLEGLARANGVREGDAHEALSDVRALIGLARRLRAAQPRFWEYALKLRDKRFVGSMVDVARMQPVLHVSQRYPASRLCAAPVAPIALHPRIANRAIVADLMQDPTRLLEESADAIAARMYLPQAALAPGETRIGLKEIHFNRCPAVVAWDHLRAPDLERLGIDPEIVARHHARLLSARDALVRKVHEIYASGPAHGAADVDGSLYDGFLPDADRERFAAVRASAPCDLLPDMVGFRDARLKELLFRYRARNWPESLDDAARAEWDAQRRARLSDPRCSEATLPDYCDELDALGRAHPGDARVHGLLDALRAWAADISAELTRHEAVPA